MGGVVHVDSAAAEALSVVLERTQAHDVVELTGHFRANLEIRRPITIRGRSASLRPADGGRPAILSEGCEVHIEGLVVEAEPHAADAIRVIGGSLSLSRCQVRGGRCGIRCEDAAVELVESHVSTHQCGQSQLGAAGVVRGCEYDDDGRVQLDRGSLTLEGCTIEGGVSGVTARDCPATLSRSVFRRNVWWGLGLYGSQDATINGNQFDECGMSIELHGVVVGEISDNAVRGSLRRAIDINDNEGATVQLTVVGNQLIGTAEQAIMVSQAASVSIEGNRIDGGWNGIYVRDGGAVTVVNNEISGVSDAAIQFSGAQASHLGANRIAADVAVAVDLGDEDNGSDAEAEARREAAIELAQAAVTLFGDDNVDTSEMDLDGSLEGEAEADDSPEDEHVGHEYVEYDETAYHGPRAFMPQHGSANELLSALDRGEQVRNVLLLGPSFRAEELAYSIARLSRARYVPVDLSMAPRPADLAAVVTHAEAEDLLFLAGLDELTHSVAAILPEILRDRSLHIAIGRGSAQRWLQLKFSSFSVVAWTVSGAVPLGLGPWDLQLAFGSEADRLADAIRLRT